MSLLADLLSKVKHSTSKREIPPNLKDIVRTSAQQVAYKRKIILISGFFIVSIISGILIVYFIRDLSGISDNKRDTSENIPTETVARVNKQFQVEGSKEDDIGGAEKEKVTRVEISPDAKEKLVTKPSKYPKSVLPRDLAKKVEIETEEVSRVERIDTFERDTYLYAARDYELKKDYPKALSLYKKVLEMDRSNVSVMNNIAYILLHLELPEESIKYSQMAVDINKNYVPALINLGVAHTKLGNIITAGEYFKKASILEPDNQSVILNLAIFYEKQKDYNAASEYYTKLIRLGKIEGFLGLARIYENEKKTEEALKIYKNIYSLNSVDDKTRILVDQRVNILNEKLRIETKK